MSVLPSDAAVREKAVDVSQSVLLTAPAGSGKTSVLEHRYLKALANSESPEQVVAITFTVAAAGEIRERALNTLKDAKLGTKPTSEHEKALYEDARRVLDLDAEKNWGILRDPSRLRIMTIDALNSLIASSLPLVSRSGGATQVESQPGELYREAVIALFADLEDETLSESLRDALGMTLDFGRHQIDRLIPLFETLLQARDQWLKPLMAGQLQDFEETLAAIVDATRQEAIAALAPAQWDTLLSVLAAGSVYDEQLEWAKDINPHKDIAGQENNIVRLAAKSLLTGEGALRKKVNKRQGFLSKHNYTDDMNELLGELADTVGPQSVSALSMLSSIPSPAFDGEGVEMLEALSLVLLRLAAHLQVVFQNSGRVDFVEVHARAMDALNMESGAGSDFLIREERIRHLLVDEMQDTSGAQIELIQRLTGEWVDGDDRSLFLCGDPQQSIYAFRGADVGQFLALWESGQLGYKTLNRLALTNNFRSAPELVDFYNGVFTELFGGHSNRWTGKVPFSKADAFRDDLKGSVNVVPFDHGAGDDLESELVCERIEQAIAEDAGCEIAVLVRSRSHLKAILPLMRKRGIPASGEEIDHLTEKSPVGDVISLIKAMAHFGDRTSWVAMLRAPFVGLTWDDCLKLVGDDPHATVRELLDDHRRLGALSPDGRRRAFRLLAVIRRIELSDRWRDIVWRSRCLWESLGGLEIADEHTASDINKVFAVLADCTDAGHLISRSRFEARLSRLYAASSGGQVKVMTIHNAKGLEFDHVFLVGLSKNTMQDSEPLIHWRSVGEDFLLVPASQSDEGVLKEQFGFLGKLSKQAALNEQRRLLYVALTRAQSTLTVFAGVKVSEKGRVSAVKNTFADMLLPFLSFGNDEIINRDVSEQVVDQERVIKVKRVSSNYAGPELAAGYRCVAPLTSIPDDEELEGLRREHSAQRAAGTTFHFLMERIAKDGLEKWDEKRVRECRKAVVALLRREGCSERLLDRAVTAILDWAVNTISSQVGRWILKSRSESWFERRISGWRDGEFFTDIMDIVFEEGDAVWVIDYKSSLKANADAAQILGANREQLERYIRTLSDQYPGRTIRGGVFVPMTQEIAELQPEAIAA